MTVLFLALPSILAACGGGTAADSGLDAAADGGALDSSVDGGVDSALDAASDGALDATPGAGPQDCMSLLTLGVDLPIAPDAPDTQIHPFAVFDGLGVWVAFSLPETSGGTGFDTWAARLACDGSFLVAPFLVNTTATAPNDVDPVVGLSGDQVLITWNADTGMAPANLQLGYRAFAVDGTPLGDDQRLTLAGGDPYTQNVLLSAIEPDGDGFRLAGIRGVEATGTFQAFTQALDATLAPVDSGAEIFAEVGVTQQNTALVSTGDGSFLAAYDRDDGMEAQVVHRSLAAGAPDPVVSVPGFVRTAGPAVAVDSTDAVGRIVALSAGSATRAQVHVVDVARPGVTAQLFGSSSRLNFAPKIVLEGGVGAVMWLRNESGIRNTLFIQGLHYGGAAFSTDAEIEITTPSPVAPYAPSLTRISDDVYFVSWAQGISPAFRIFGRFVRVR